MILDGYIVKLDMDDIDKMVSLLRSSSNNLNQIAKKANAANTIYGADIAEMRMNRYPGQTAGKRSQLCQVGNGL